MGQSDSKSLKQAADSHLADFAEAVLRDGHGPTSVTILNLHLVFLACLKDGPEVKELCQHLSLEPSASLDDMGPKCLLDHYHRVFALFCDMVDQKESALAMIDTLHKQTKTLVLLTDEGEEMVPNPEVADSICNQLADHCRWIDPRLDFFRSVPERPVLTVLQSDLDQQTDALQVFLETQRDYLQNYFWEAQDNNCLFNPITCQRIILT